jgi:hypothetical protein
LPLVNRVAEIGQLLQAWELAKTGRGHTVEITGEPGIGKSRLALELIDKTGLSDDLILAVEASAQHQNTPLHLSEAGRTSRAAQMWLKAAKQAAERSANLEAVAQLNTARDEIGKLPAGLERDNLELNAQFALIGPTIALQGFGADAVADVSSRAIELCRTLDNDPRIFPALYARWSYLRVASDVREAGALARDFLTLAELKGTRADRMLGHRLLGTSLLDGETEKARDHLERAAKLYDAAADRSTAVIYGTDVQITSLSNLCITCWLVGRVTEAVARGRDALEYADQLSHAHTLGYAYDHVCMLYTLERDVPKVQALAQRVLAGAIERELPLWISVSRSFLGWSEVESGRLAEASTSWRSSATSCRRRTSSTGCPPTSAGSLRLMSTPIRWRKPDVVLSRRAACSRGAATTGTRSSAFVSKAGLLRTRKSKMRRSLNGTSSNRWRSPVSAANEDLPCARRSVLPTFSPRGAIPNVHTGCCKMNYNSSPISRTAAIVQKPKRYCDPSK